MSRQSSQAAPTIAPRMLKLLGDLVVNDQRVQARDGKTFCNFAVQKIGEAYGIEELHGPEWPLLANDMHALFLANPKRYQPIPLEQVHGYANHGALVIPSAPDQPNGHVCFAVPGRRRKSGNWGGLVPMVANVGQKRFTGIVHLGFAFSPARDPLFFLFTGK